MLVYRVPAEEGEGQEEEPGQHHQEEILRYGSRHRRKMETEGKAKVVASVWWAKFVQLNRFLAEQAVLPRSI